MELHPDVTASFGEAVAGYLTPHSVLMTAPSSYDTDQVHKESGKVSISSDVLTTKYQGKRPLLRERGPRREKLRPEKVGACEKEKRTLTIWHKVYETQSDS